MTDKNTIPEEWQPLLAQHKRRIAAGRAMGGEQKLSKRKASGQLNARELIELFCDADSFFEIGTLAGSIGWHNSPAAAADALVCGHAKIAGRDVLIGVEDFTVQGGSIGPVTNAKRLRLTKIAHHTRVPLIMLLDGAGVKAIRLLDIANAFHVPVIFLADNHGILSGRQAEREGTLRAAARMYAAQARLSSPKLHVTLQKAFGFCSSLMAMNPFDAQIITLALPGITLGGMPVASGGHAAQLDQATSAEVSAAQHSGA